jgi:DNA-binding NarL/FixJ family response regulator
VRPIRIAVEASDPLDRAGLVSHLGSHPDRVLLLDEQRTDADVLVFCCARLTTEVIAALRDSAAAIGSPVVLVVDEISEDDLPAAVAGRVVAILPRFSLTAERLVFSVMTAKAGAGATVAPNPVGTLLRHIKQTQRGATAAGLRPPEIEVLRLIADGWDTEAIAERLHYPERTVKAMIYEVINRLDLRSRSHAVAYAVRAGVI